MIISGTTPETISYGNKWSGHEEDCGIKWKIWWQ
jgi:hypothetical protein